MIVGDKIVVYINMIPTYLFIQLKEHINIDTTYTILPNINRYINDIKELI